MAIKNFVQKNIDPSSSGTGTSSSGPVTLTYWSLWEPEETFHKSLAEYAQQNPGVTINFVKQSHQDYRTRLMTAISKGEGPDIFRFHNTWVPMLEKELSPLDKSAYTPDEFGNTFYQIIKNDLTNSQGELVGVPLMIDGLVMYINQEVFDNAGLGAPTTWVELENVAKQLTLYDDRQRIERSGVALGTTSNVDHWSDIVAAMMLQNSVNLNDVAGSVDPVGNSLAGDALRYYISFAKTHRFWDDTLPESALAFATGKAVVFFGPSWRANEIQQINPALKFTMHSLPQLPGGQTSWATYWVEGVSSQSPNQPEAMKLLKFLSSKQSLEDMFESTSRVRIFGLPYPRLDQTDLLMAHPYLASIGNQAPYFKTWYLASNTFDNGINEEMIKYFKDAINSITAGDDVDIVLQTVTQGVTQVLTKYGIPVN